MWSWKDAGLETLICWEKVSERERMLTKVNVSGAGENVTNNTL